MSHGGVQEGGQDLVAANELQTLGRGPIEHVDSAAVLNLLVEIDGH